MGDGGSRPEGVRAATERACGAAAIVRRTYDAGEVAELVRRAYESGRADRYEEDLAELHVSWLNHAGQRRTYDARVRARVRDMQAYAERLTWYRWRGHYPGGPVDFDTGELARRSAA